MSYDILEKCDTQDYFLKKINKTYKKLYKTLLYLNLIKKHKKCTFQCSFFFLIVNNLMCL